MARSEPRIHFNRRARNFDLRARHAAFHAQLAGNEPDIFIERAEQFLQIFRTARIDLRFVRIFFQFLLLHLILFQSTPLQESRLFFRLIYYHKISIFQRLYGIFILQS